MKKNKGATPSGPHPKKPVKIRELSECPGFSYKTQKKKRLFIFVFILVNLFVSTYYLDIWLTPNSVSRSLPVLSMFHKGSLVIDDYKAYTGDISLVNGHYYSDKAPFSTLMVYPFYRAARMAGWAGFDSATVCRYPIHIWEYTGLQDGRRFVSPEISSVLVLGSFITGVVPFVLIILITFLSIRKIGGFTPAFLAMAVFYSSFVFVYAGVFFGHVLAGFFLLVAYLALKHGKYFFLGGLSLGLAFATEYPIAIIIPVWLLQMILTGKSLKSTLNFLLGMVPGGLFILLYNYSITGSAFTPLYTFVANEQYKGVSNLGFGFPSLTALYGLLFTLNRGLFFYAPVLLVASYYLVRNSVKNHGKFSGKGTRPFISSVTGNYLASAVVLYLLLISAHLMWTGGWAFGPRHLIPVVILLLYETACYLAKYPAGKLVFVIFVLAGLLMTWMAKSTKLYMLPDWPAYTNPFFDIIIPDFTAGKLNACNIMTWKWNIAPAFANYIWLLLMITSLWLLGFWNRKIIRVAKTPAR
ncbi:MAG: hypothetical protein WCO44_13230 [Bacteroidota bacterium]